MDNGTFSMEGDAQVDSGNEVCLWVNPAIAVTGNLSAAAAALIRPYPYTDGKTVLNGAALAANYGRFQVKPNGTDVWTIDSEGRLVAPRWNITWNLDGGSWPGTPPANQVVTGGKIAEPAAPTKAAYAFGGWYGDAGLSTAWDFDDAVTADTALYAKWTYTAPGVYVAGRYYFNDDNIPCYWENGTRIDLAVSGSSVANAMAVSGGDIYVAGYYRTDSPSPVNHPCYWKNGTLIDLAVPGSGIAYAMAVSGGDIYVAGYCYSSGYMRPCYWKNGTRIDLTLTGTGIEGVAYAMAVSGGDIYVAGVYRNSSGYTMRPCYWKNGTQTDLAVPGGVVSYANAMAVSGGDVYIAGFYQDNPPTTLIPCYWKNGTLIDLAVPGSSVAEAITVSGGDVYVTGYCFVDPNDQRPCYWKNGARTLLEPSGSGNASAITVSGGDVYIAGNYKGGACYWKNGTRTDLTTPTQSYATSIAVVE